MVNDCMSGGGDLSELELLILRSIPKAKDIIELGRVAKVDPATLGNKIATLQMKGYVGEDGTLSKRGVEALQRTRSK
jgi:DNA-binding MarR family transcriptional regulator